MSYTPPLLDPKFKISIETMTRETFHRVYWAGQDPLKPSVAGNNRYDCPAYLPSKDQFGVLYMGYDLTTCWMETVVRHNMIRPAGLNIMVPLARLKDRWACEISSQEPLVLAQFADESLVDLGDCVSNIMNDSYMRTQVWSLLFHSHKNPAVDGIRYRSRLNSGQFCIALFGRAAIKKKLSAAYTQSLNPAISLAAQSILKRYGVVPC